MNYELSTIEGKYNYYSKMNITDYRTELFFELDNFGLFSL